MQDLRKNKRNGGFTLVELAIVLVIIGLIIGGVLVGQDLIRAAEIRATIAQAEKYNTAVNTFRDKYRGYPGDILNTDAARFGFATRAGTNGQGDGDRLLEGCTAAAGTISGLLFGCETGLFWADMNQAGFVDGGFSSATDGSNGAIVAGDMAEWLPAAKLGLGHYFTVFSNSGRNYFQVARVTAIAGTGGYTLENSLPPQMAFNIDDKLDDADPYSGTVVALGSTGAAPHALNGAPSAGAAAGNCTTSATGEYNTAGDEEANAPACQLRLRTSF